MNNTSYRDPEGFVYKNNELIHRFVSLKYKEDYEFLKSSGLLKSLISKKQIVNHQEINENHLGKKDWFLTLLPDQIPVITQPSQWSFSMLKDAALLTLKIQKNAIDHGMSLKDATPFNVQIHNGKFIFIDTTSFEKNDFNKPWIAYRQFCENFLAPLVLMQYGGVEFGKILESFPNGLPLEQVVGLLPLKAKFNFGIYLHLVSHAKYKTKGTSKEKIDRQRNTFSKSKTQKIINHLFETICDLHPKNINDKNWDNYYDETILGDNYLENKKIDFENQIQTVSFTSAIDLGCNDGVFSEILSKYADKVISCDFDRHCIDKIYRKNKTIDNSKITPICLDLAAPTPSIGYINKERLGFFESTNAELVCALAIIHHLRISNNMPLDNIFKMLHQLSNKYVLIEFVPKSDEKVIELLSSREDIFDDYEIESFKEKSKHFFDILETKLIENSERTMFLFAKK